MPDWEVRHNTLHDKDICSCLNYLRQPITSSRQVHSNISRYQNRLSHRRVRHLMSLCPFRPNDPSDVLSICTLLMFDSVNLVAFTHDDWRVLFELSLRRCRLRSNI